MPDIELLKDLQAMPLDMKVAHNIFDIRCMDCQKDSRIICNFEYNLTSGIECDHPTEKGGVQE